MKKIGFLFAGQGSQYVGMGKDMYDNYPQARAVFDKVNLDFDVAKLCFEGEKAQLDDTAYAQSAILVTSMAIAEVIKSKGIIPSYIAGLSLGEYSALCYANAIKLEDAACIVRERGKLMGSALPAGTTMMLAVLNSNEALIKEVCKEVESIGVCEIANYNTPQQIVITGKKEAVEKAKDLLLEKGVRRVIPLNVSGAFHSSLLEDTSKKLNDILKSYTFNKPEIPVIYNISGKEEPVETSNDLVEILTKQIKSSVYFMQSIEYMIEQGVEAFIEIGPGSTLAGFVRKINKNIPVYSVEDQASLEKMLGDLK